MLSMSGEREAGRPRRSRSPGRLIVTAGVSLFLMADHIFHNRRGLPALVVKAPEAATTRRTFALPEPLFNQVFRRRARPRRERSDRPR